MVKPRKCCNETSVSIKFGEFLDYVIICQLLKKKSAVWSWLELVSVLYIHLDV